MIKLFLFITFLFLASPASNDIIIGKIIRVSDGDTVVILNEKNERVRLRFAEIDAPEKGQDYFNKATDFVKELTASKNIKIIQTGTDKYKRPLVTLYVDGLNINEALVRNGLAWHYKAFSKSVRLDSLEREARKEKLNIWSLKNLTPPWEYRKMKKQKSPAK